MAAVQRRVECGLKRRRIEKNEDAVRRLGALDPGGGVGGGGVDSGCGKSPMAASSAEEHASRGGRAVSHANVSGGRFGGCRAVQGSGSGCGEEAARKASRLNRRRGAGGGER